MHTIQKGTTAMKTPEWIARHSFVPRASVSALIDAYAEWDDEVDTFVLAWDRYYPGPRRRRP